MATITSAGTGSGLDINGIVTQLVAAEKAPADKRLTAHDAVVQAKLSTLAIVKSSVAEFQTSLSSLKSLSGFQSKTAVVGNTALLSATTSSAAKAGQHSVNVTKLAQSQKLASKSFASANATVGTGTLHIDFGAYSADGETFTSKKSGIKIGRAHV